MGYTNAEGKWHLTRLMPVTQQQHVNQVVFGRPSRTHQFSVPVEALLHGLCRVPRHAHALLPCRSARPCAQCRNTSGTKSNSCCGRPLSATCRPKSMRPAETFSMAAAGSPHTALTLAAAAAGATGAVVARANESRGGRQGGGAGGWQAAGAGSRGQ